MGKHCIRKSFPKFREWALRRVGRDINCADRVVEGTPRNALPEVHSLESSLFRSRILRAHVRITISRRSTTRTYIIDSGRRSCSRHAALTVSASCSRTSSSRRTIAMSFSDGPGLRVQLRPSSQRLRMATLEGHASNVVDATVSITPAQARHS